MSARPAFASVPAYLAALSPEHVPVLKRVLALIRKSVPRCTRVISYGIPAFKQDRVFIYCAAFKRHIGIYPPVRADDKLRAALLPYANAKGNLSFPYAEPMPYALIVRVAKSLAKQRAVCGYYAMTPSSREADMIKHFGGCHCGRVRYEVQAPASLQVSDCNCSICAKSCYLHLIVPKSQFTLLTGTDALTTYQFNTGTARHLFCARTPMATALTPGASTLTLFVK
jgi:uncharacterized protein YdhG (YjbR/CyaY superfamily)